MMIGTGLILHRKGTDGGLCEGGNEPAGSLNAISAEEAGTAEFVKSEPAVVSLISISSGRSMDIWMKMDGWMDMDIAHLNAIDLAPDRTRNLGHRRPALYQLANQVDGLMDGDGWIDMDGWPCFGYWEEWTVLAMKIWLKIYLGKIKAKRIGFLMESEEPINAAYERNKPSPAVASQSESIVTGFQTTDILEKLLAQLKLTLQTLVTPHFDYCDVLLSDLSSELSVIQRAQNMCVRYVCNIRRLLSKNLKVTIYKTVILPVVLYVCETWTLTLREEHRLRVFENKVLRKIFGAKRDEVTGEWRKLHNAELHALYSSPDIIRNLKSRRFRWAGHVARMGESRNAYRVLVGRPEGKRPLGRPRRRWEDNIKMNLREVGYDDRDWINLAQDRDRWRAYVRAAMNLRHVWADENPHAVEETRHQHRFSINVWAVVLGDRLIGPYVLPQRLAGDRYQDFLINVLPTLLEYVPCQQRLQMWFMMAH
ncbi:hypothetical protein ANN_16875 [Periplaneta americana]|uniref:Uncharacterized protein n=1 Tax=Periplaneta americana TaxID=6978 RepID=A0ABQ8SS48_PERAM|nr:hypothetical protein ANN_16875 [Periplaneta americana]